MLTWGHSSVCKKLYAKARIYEGTWCYIRVDLTDAGQVLDLIKAAPEAAPTEGHVLWLLQARGLTYNFLQTEE